MGDHEIVEMRHPARSSDEDREETLQVLDLGVEESGIARRPLVRNSLLGAVGILLAPVVVLLRDLGPTNNQVAEDQPYPGAGLENTVWETGMRVVRDVVGTPIRPGDLEIGDLVNAEPEIIFEVDEDGEPVLEGVALQIAKSKGAVVLVRMEPDDIKPAKGRENWAVDGILCYSKICTHVGCPISLNERKTHHLLCPCHQSTFDLADAAKVVFGPAARPLPQLPLMVDDEGYLVAQSDFNEPVGPSFWERDSQGARANEQRHEHRHQQGRHDEHRPRPPPRSPTASAPSPSWADDRLGLATAGQEEPAQGLPRPLVVHARRDRALELRRPAAHRRLPDPVVQPEHGRGDVRRLLRPAARHPDVRGLRLDAATSRSTSAAAC